MANPAAAAQPRTRRGAVTARPAARRRSRRHHGAPPRARWRRVPAPATACDRLRPPRPPRPPRLLPASGLPTTRQLRPPARGCWAGAGADAAPSRRGLLVPCACSAAGRPAAPSPPLAWCCAAAAGFAMARVASAVPEHERLGRWAFPCWTGFRLAKSADSCRILSLVYSGTKKKGPTTSPSPINLRGATLFLHGVRFLFYEEEPLEPTL